ncbi:hypothetical protein AGMMS4952_25360 [Spirochaetia bacterium]|nr:hypothetical protein AGMMS4952_25360 [Spirochaetia bacterium]
MEERDFAAQVAALVSAVAGWVLPEGLEGVLQRKVYRRRSLKIQKYE